MVIMRIRSLEYSFAALFIALAGFLYHLQISKGHYYQELSSRNSIRLLSIDAPRGIIYDRNNKVVVTNSLSFGVFIVPQEAKDVDAEIKKIAGILGAPESLLKRSYKRNYRAPFAPCELIRNIEKNKAILIEELKLDIPGVLVKEIPLRDYVYKEALAHVVGYIGEIDRAELAALKSYGYSVKDLIGKDGIEKVEDGYLRGSDGGMQVQVDNRGRQVEVLSFKRPRKGMDIYLTLDADLQNFIWNMMKETRGAAVFMDPHSGEILSMVSAPSFDPNSSLAWALYDSDTPLLNRAIKGQYPPGSLFKIVVALAGLESEKVLPDSNFLCRGKLKIGRDEFNCWKRDGHGQMCMNDAIIESCNVYFYNMGILTGMEKISEYARLFGFGRKTGIELLGEKEGFVPSRAWKRAEKKEPWFTGDTANFSIGQGYLLATPLQVARMMAIVASGGEIVEPHLLRRIENTDVSGYKKANLRIKKEDFEVVKNAMKQVVAGARGTGAGAWSSLVSISAKTGTSQVGGGLNTHAWFAGFAPSDKPEIAFVVFLEHGGSGGDMPAVIAKEAVEYWYRHK